ncbi:hypothetical protein Tco_1021676 [Tanacetum coccineum]
MRMAATLLLKGYFIYQAESPSQLSEKYFHSCAGNSRRECITTFKGTVLPTGLCCANDGERKLQADDANHVFKS